MSNICQSASVSISLPLGFRVIVILSVLSHQEKIVFRIHCHDLKNNVCKEDFVEQSTLSSWLSEKNGYIVDGKMSPIVWYNFQKGSKRLSQVQQSGSIEEPQQQDVVASPEQDADNSSDNTKEQEQDTSFFLSCFV